MYIHGNKTSKVLLPDQVCNRLLLVGERRKLRLYSYIHFIRMKKLCKAAFKETNKMPRIFHTPETTVTQNVNYTSKKATGRETGWTEQG